VPRWAGSPTPAQLEPGKAPIPPYREDIRSTEESNPEGYPESQKEALGACLTNCP